MAIKPPPRRYKTAGYTISAGIAVIAVLAAAYVFQAASLHVVWSSAPAVGGTGRGGVPASSSAKHAVDAATRQQCEGTLGTWCMDYLTQAEAPAVTAPRGNKTCSLDCVKVGVCSALTGLCTCPAGFQDFNCMKPLKRHCVHKWRTEGFERGPMPVNATETIGVENSAELTRSRCAGFCDDTVAACYCPSNTTYGRIPAPPDAPLDAPPVRAGRPMGHFCQPNITVDGRATTWGTTDPEDLFGTEGWCMAEKPRFACNCFIPGYGGATCEDPYEMFCFNQCNARGECKAGYCKCDPGWHGIDCAHRSAAPLADASEALREARLRERPWIREHVHTPAAQDFAANATRRRPLVYVYELPADYATLVMQYRVHDGGLTDCVPRFFRPEDNGTELTHDYTYNLESGFLEMLLQSGHRTLDPEEADYFYVPVFTSCFMYPVRDGADSLRDWWYSPFHYRVHGAANMLLEAYHWLSSHLPYWDRRGGRDHIWLVTHDEASCWVPAAIRPSIILSHWGRMDANHTSGSAYGDDVYSDEVVHPQFEPFGFQRKIAGHPCYDPVKDLIVPLMKPPFHYHASPLIGGAARKRPLLAFHYGRVQHHLPAYSRGIRQRLDTAARQHQWLHKYKILIADNEGAERVQPADVSGDYSEMLSSSVFCLVVPGDGWSARMEDAMLHGCIPTIIMDNVHVSFESIVDLSRFTVRVPEADAEKLPDILLAIPREQREEMQRALGRLWQKWTYTSYRPYATQFTEIQQQNAAQAGEDPPTLSLPARIPDLDPLHDDAFHTIMGWLHGRIPATR